MATNVREAHQRRAPGGRRLVPRSLVLAGGLAIFSASAPAFAVGLDGGVPAASLGLGALSSLPMRPIGRVASPGHLASGSTGGFFLGVDTGVSLAVATGYDPSQYAWTFGGRAGYELPSGLAVQVRYDYLGLSPHLTEPPTGRTQTASAGLRYSLPFLIPLPFVEALWGPAFHGDTVAIAGAIGVGGSVPIGRHLRLDASVRDWITPIDGQVHQVLTFELGAAVSFASPAH